MKKYGTSFSANAVGTKFNGIFCDPFADYDECGPDGILISPKLTRYETQLREFAASDLQAWVTEYVSLDHSAKFAARNKLEAAIQKRLNEIVSGTH